MNVGFLCNSMCFLRYYVPIINELNRWNDSRCTLFIHKRDKYDEPRRHLQALEVLGRENDFVTRGTSSIPNFKQDFFFTMEGELADYADAPVYSMTCQTDFRFSYPKYKDKIHTLIAPSKFLTDYYNVFPPRVKYFQPTKYADTHYYDTSQIVAKYGLPCGKQFVLLIFPRTRDLDKKLVHHIIDELNQIGFNVIIKTRGKDVVEREFAEKAQVFADYSWHPHSTLELLHISEFAINFDSTAIEECLFMDVPVINFPCKKHVERGLDFLYDEKDFCRDKTEKDLNLGDVAWATNRTVDFEKIRRKYYGHEDGLYEMISHLKRVYKWGEDE